jgi:hypothetical protein
MVRVRIAALTLLLLVVACRGERIVEATPKGDFEVALAKGESVTLSDGSTVTFRDVLGESRCPKSVVCAWAGEGSIRLAIARPRTTPAVVDLTTMKPVQSTTGYEVRLLELDPYPEEPGPIPASQYHATLRLTPR